MTAARVQGEGMVEPTGRPGAFTALRLPSFLRLLHGTTLADGPPWIAQGTLSWLVSDLTVSGAMLGASIWSAPWPRWGSRRTPALRSKPPAPHAHVRCQWLPVRRARGVGPRVAEGEPKGRGVHACRRECLAVGPRRKIRWELLALLI